MVCRCAQVAEQMFLHSYTEAVKLSAFQPAWEVTLPGCVVALGPLLQLMVGKALTWSAAPYGTDRLAVVLEATSRLGSIHSVCWSSEYRARTNRLPTFQRSR